MSEPTIHEVSKELATLRERMNTHQAKYEGALDRFHATMSKNDAAFERLRTDMANNLAKNQGAFEELRTDMAKRDADMAKRDADAAHREIIRLRWQIGIWIAGVLVTIAALGIFIRLAI